MTFERIAPSSACAQERGGFLLEHGGARARVGAHGGLDGEAQLGLPRRGDGLGEDGGQEGVGDVLALRGLGDAQRVE